MKAHQLFRMIPAVALLFVALATACTDRTVNSTSDENTLLQQSGPISLVPSFPYPLTPGVTWEYAETLRLIDSEGNLEFINPRVRTVEGMGLETLSNGQIAFRMKEVLADFYSVYESNDFLTNEPSGLYTHGWNQQWRQPPDNNPKLRLQFGGETFESYSELRDRYLTKLPSLRDEIYDPPRKLLEYPMEVGNSWMYCRRSSPFGIDKEVIAFRPVTVPAGTFAAYQVLWKYDLDGTGSCDEGVNVWDEVSASGLLSRRIFFTGIGKLNDNGEVIATFTSTEESWLTSITHRSELVANQ